MEVKHGRLKIIKQLIHLAIYTVPKRAKNVHWLNYDQKFCLDVNKLLSIIACFHLSSGYIADPDIPTRGGPALEDQPSFDQPSFD